MLVQVGLVSIQILPKGVSICSVIALVVVKAVEEVAADRNEGKGLECPGRLTCPAFDAA